MVESVQSNEARGECPRVVLMVFDCGVFVCADIRVYSFNIVVICIIFGFVAYVYCCLFVIQSIYYRVVIS